MIDRIKKVTLTSDTQEVKFAQRYKYFWVNNLGDNDCMFSIENDLENSYFTVKSGASACTMHGYPLSKLYLKGDGDVQICGSDIAVNPFNSAKGGGGDYVTKETLDNAVHDINEDINTKAEAVHMHNVTDIIGLPAISSILNSMSTNATAAGSKAVYDFVLEALANISTFSAVVVDSISDVTDSDKMYLIRKSDTTEDIYDEYLCINGTPELIGSTAMDLSDYATKSDISDLQATIPKIYTGSSDTPPTEFYNNEGAIYIQYVN